MNTLIDVVIIGRNEAVRLAAASRVTRFIVKLPPMVSQAKTAAIWLGGNLVRSGGLRKGRKREDGPVSPGTGNTLGCGV